MAQKGICGKRLALHLWEGFPGELTTGTTSSWILAGKGTKPRNALRYSCWSRISWGPTGSASEFEAYCNEEGEDGDGLLCACHGGHRFVSVCYVTEFGVVLKESGGIVWTVVKQRGVPWSSNGQLWGTRAALRSRDP